MKRRTAAWLSILATAILGTAPSGAVYYDLKGSIRSRLAVFSPVVGDVPPEGGQRNHVPPEGGQRNTYNLELRARPELTLYLKDGLSANLTVRGQRNWGATEDAFGSGGVDLDRAFLDIALDRWDLRVGRQAINFGQALIWNPVDLVDSNSPLDFDIVKEGVDTFRASYAVSATASVLGLVAFPPGGALTLVRGETLAGGADLGLLAAVDTRTDERILGFDVKGDLGVGWWVEGAWHDLEKGDDFLRLVVGLDYSWPVRQQLYLALQYYRDGSGGTGVEDYDYASLGTTRRFLARQYASVISGLTFNELTSLNGSMIYNLEDRSYVLTLGLARVFFDNLEVNVRGSLFDGSGPGEYNPVAGSPAFGRQPTETFELYLEWRF